MEIGAMIWIPVCLCRPRRNLTGALRHGLSVPPAPKCGECGRTYPQPPERSAMP